MPSYSRNSVPENFYDITTDMLLVQPEPQYLYAMMWLGAMSLSLPTPAELGLAGRGVGGNGAPYINEERDRLMLANPMFTEVIAAGVDFNGLPGNTVRLNRPVFANTTYTAASRTIAEGTTITTTPITVGSQQTNLTLQRFGGPYDTSNSRPAPYAIERFSSSMGVHKAASIHGTHLKRDFHRFIESVQIALLDLASSAVYPEGMTAVNDATTTGQYPLTYEQLTRVEQTADDANLPTFADGFRAIVLTPTQLRQLANDPDYMDLSKETNATYSPLFPTYVASVGKLHIFKSTTLTVTANASSVNIHYGHLICPGVLLGGMGEPPAVIPNTQDNYAQTALVMWIANLAFGLSNNTFVISVRSSA